MFLFIDNTKRILIYSQGEKIMFFSLPSLSLIKETHYGEETESICFDEERDILIYYLKNSNEIGFFVSYE